MYEELAGKVAFFNLVIYILANSINFVNSLLLDGIIAKLRVG